MKRSECRWWDFVRESTPTKRQHKPLSRRHTAPASKQQEQEIRKTTPAKQHEPSRRHTAPSSKQHEHGSIQTTSARQHELSNRQTILIKQSEKCKRQTTFVKQSEHSKRLTTLAKQSEQSKRLTTLAKQSEQSKRQTTLVKQSEQIKRQTTPLSKQHEQCSRQTLVCRQREQIKILPSIGSNTSKQHEHRVSVSHSAGFNASKQHEQVNVSHSAGYNTSKQRDRVKLLSSAGYNQNNLLTIPTKQVRKSASKTVSKTTSPVRIRKTTTKVSTHRVCIEPFPQLDNLSPDIFPVPDLTKCRHKDISGHNSSWLNHPKILFPIPGSRKASRVLIIDQPNLEDGIQTQPQIEKPRPGKSRNVNVSFRYSVVADAVIQILTNCTSDKKVKTCFHRVAAILPILTQADLMIAESKGRKKQKKDKKFSHLLTRKCGLSLEGLPDPAKTEEWLTAAEWLWAVMPRSYGLAAESCDQDSETLSLN